MSQRDYAEFLESLNASGVRYLIIGGQAVAYHARPRFTKDLDILIERSRDNAERVLRAIRDFFGGTDLDVTVADLTEPHNIVQLGVAPARIDLLSSLSSTTNFADLWKGRLEGTYGGVQAHYISLDDLIREKKSTNRDQDRADVKALERARKRLRGRGHRK